MNCEGECEGEGIARNIWRWRYRVAERGRVGQERQGDGERERGVERQGDVERERGLGREREGK